MDEILFVFLKLLLLYPGALIRWAFFYRGKKTIQEVAGDDIFKNVYVGVLVLGFVIGFVYSTI